MAALWEQRRDVKSSISEKWWKLYNSSTKSSRKSMITGLLAAYAGKLSLTVLRDWDKFLDERLNSSK